MRLLLLLLLCVFTSCSSTGLKESGYQSEEKKEFNRLLPAASVATSKVILEIVRPELEMGWHRSLQKAEITDAYTKQRLFAALQDSVEMMEDDGYGCFEPRYRLTFDHKGTKRILNISFACRKLHLMVGEQVIALAVHDKALDLFYAEARRLGLDKARSDRFE